MKTLLQAVRAMPTFSSLAAVVCLAPLVAQAQFLYTSNNGTITITGYIGLNRNVTIPSTIIGLPVTRIGNNAFNSGDNRAKLTSVTIPHSVTTIGESAFYSCTNLANVTIGTNVTSIGGWAFSGCTSLTNVTIPASVTAIGDWALDDCNSLASIVVDTLNSVYSSVDGILFNKLQTTLIDCPNGKAGSFTIPDTVTSIRDAAFLDCAKLTSVTIASSVTNVGQWAFQYCTSLTNVIINDSITSIGDAAFYYCVNLTSIMLGDNITSIGGSAFAICTNLTTVTIPDSTTRLGDYAFASCSNLARVEIGNSVTNIGRDTFDGCTNLSSVTIGRSVTNIGDFAFLYCSSLTSITIPSSVASIGNGTFAYCTILTGVYFEGSAPSHGWDCFYSSDNVTIYYLPAVAGWGPIFADRPTVLWNPRIETDHPTFGVGPNGFGFIIAGTADIPIVVEAAPRAPDGTWVPLQSCTLTNGSLYFSDPDWTNHPARFYRVRSP